MASQVPSRSLVDLHHQHKFNKNMETLVLANQAQALYRISTRRVALRVRRPSYYNPTDLRNLLQLRNTPRRRSHPAVANHTPLRSLPSLVASGSRDNRPFIYRDVICAGLRSSQTLKDSIYPMGQHYDDDDDPSNPIHQPIPIISMQHLRIMRAGIGPPKTYDAASKPTKFVLCHMTCPALTELRLRR